VLTQRNLKYLNWGSEVLMKVFSEEHGRRSRFMVFLALTVLLLSFSSPFVLAQQPKQDMPPMDDMPGMDMSHGSMSMEETPAQAAKHAKDKRESEFNHHLAGFLVVVAGIFLLAQDRLAKRWPGVRYVWPSCFLLAGVYLALFSDTEIWPVGRESLWFAIHDNPEDLQHKIFALILLFLGTVELQRARGKLKSMWAAWVFPILGVAGAILLLFHHHSAGMHGAHHMETMYHIKAEHLAFSIVGGGVALTKGLSEVRSGCQSALQKIWPSLMIVLGILLMFYTE
jgi:putative copper resistance protein D